MVDESELEGFRRDRYLARSWALLTRDRGWIKPVLLMTVALLVPIVGILGVLGYALEWARLTAWNVNAAPKQRGVAVGACIKSGWRAFLVMLVWGIVSALIVGVFEALPLLGAVIALAWLVLWAGYAVIVMCASLRATIYQRFVAGVRVRTIWQMVRHDPGGLARIAGMVLVGSAVMGAVAAVVVIVSMLSVMPRLVWIVSALSTTNLYMMSDLAAGALALEVIAALLSMLGPALVVLVLVDGLLGVVLSLLSYTAVGLWFRQFDVASWGRDEDPLPDFVSDPRDQPRPSSTSAPEPPSPAPDAAPSLPEDSGVTLDPEAPQEHGPERRAEKEPTAGAEGEGPVAGEAQATDDDGPVVEGGR